MAIVWQLDGVRPVDPSTMRIRITEFIDGIQTAQFAKSFPKTATEEQVLTQLAQLVKQQRQADLDARVPFNSLDMSDFETRVANA